MLSNIVKILYTVLDVKICLCIFSKLVVDWLFLLMLSVCLIYLTRRELDEILGVFISLVNTY